MGTKHTPGPWEIEPSDDGQSHWIVPAASNGCGWVGDRYMRVSGPIDIHDARLIAAAPDLLAALQDCFQWFENDSPLDAPCGPEMRKAREAIAKATGSAA